MEESFKDFLTQEIPTEATRFQKEMTYFGGSVTVYGETPYDAFMREDGKKCVAFIDDLTEAVLKGHILYPQPKNQQLSAAEPKQSEKRSAVKPTIIVAVISAIAAISVAVIQRQSKPELTPSDIAKRSFVGRVRDVATEAPIRNAKVTLEGQDVPPVAYTDSEGVFSFPIADQRPEFHIRVEADGYENFDRRIVPSSNIGMEDIRVQPRVTR